MGHIVVVVLLGTTDELVEELFPNEGDCAGHADEDVQLLSGRSKTLDLDPVVAVDVGSGVRCDCCHNFQVLGAQRPGLTFTTQSYIKYFDYTS